MHLPCAEFAINNSHTPAIGTTPFFLNYGRHPKTPLHLALATGTTRRDAVTKQWSKANPTAQALAENLRSRMKDAEQCLRAARDRMLARNKGRKPKTFAVGDKVMLSTKNIQFKGPNVKKLLPRWIGPFPIIKTVGPAAYRLDLLDNMRIHPTFHVELLRPYYPSERHPPQPSPLEIEGQEEFEVEFIHAHKFRKGRKNKRVFLVRWKGYGPEHDTWEPEDNLKNCPDALHDYIVKAKVQGTM